MSLITTDVRDVAACAAEIAVSTAGHAGKDVDYAEAFSDRKAT